jgi:hypothetical protein
VACDLFLAELAVLRASVAASLISSVVIVVIVVVVSSAIASVIIITPITPIFPHGERAIELAAWM